MKKVLKSVLVLAIFSLAFISCKKDEIDDKISAAKPVITDLEVGGHHGDHDHDHAGKKEDHAEGHIGEELHVQAKIVAEGKIAYIAVEIHNEATGVDVIEERKFNVGYKGQLNATFHEHIAIPLDTKEGDYHFHLKVVDELGQTTEVEKELHLEEEALEPAPVANGITIEELGHVHNGENVLHIGEEAHVEAKIEVSEAITAIVVEVHNEKTDVEVFEKVYKDAKYVGKTKVDFHEHMDIPAATAEGHAHFHLKVLGAGDKVLAESEKEVHIEKE